MGYSRAQRDDLLGRIEATGGLQGRPKARGQGATTGAAEDDFGRSIRRQPDTPLGSQCRQRGLEGGYIRGEKLCQRIHIGDTFTRQSNYDLTLKWWQGQKINSRRSSFHDNP